MNDGHGDVRSMKCKPCHVSFLEQEVANFILLNSKLTTKLV